MDASDDVNVYRKFALQSFLSKDPVAKNYLSAIKNETDIDEELLQKFYRVHSSLQSKQMMIKVGKSIVRQGLVFAKTTLIKKLPMLKYISPENITLELNEDEYLALIHNINTSSSKPANLYYVIAKNMLVEILNVNLMSLSESFQHTNLTSEQLETLTNKIIPAPNNTNDIIPEDITAYETVPEASYLHEFLSTSNTNSIVDEPHISESPIPVEDTIYIEGQIDNTSNDTQPETSSEDNEVQFENNQVTDDSSNTDLVENIKQQTTIKLSPLVKYASTSKLNMPVLSPIIEEVTLKRKTDSNESPSKHQKLDLDYLLDNFVTIEEEDDENSVQMDSNQQYTAINELIKKVNHNKQTKSNTETSSIVQFSFE